MPGRRNFQQPTDALMLWVSVLPVLLFFAELSIGSSGAPVFCRTHPIQCFFEFFLHVLFCMAFLLHPWDLEMFT